MFSVKPKLRWLVLGLVTLGLLLGCQSLSQGDPAAPPQVVRGIPQYLPITAKARIHDTWIQLEVARTPAQQQLGLMFRSELPPDRGMLFPISPPQVASFWMKNCLISLDLIFLRDGKVVAIAPAAPPCETLPCPTYESGVPVDAVLELAGGRAAELGLKVNDSVKIQYLAP
ncbi:MULTISPECIES: DUF192 domain-containing protein [unclassified Thermosynechococcus]|uniref:DUF192 domain-containing protein n=1 Tax=unclassified Thermosynechococcus TaxID=2622553 RepID=UPI002873238D|nr:MULTISPECIES: DUF192 domain-containing protein [unclassified Thermosynechococcus]WNC32053.1 DUF192 domain-containing protein [Thermosynechococcus sp. PKX95]WNC34582.1 DUF192 domain-containing protein [Thermosynechococcus sp. PKX91]WNC37100.1 DUF192 domain-containing protein [Thermosynechococcus sp. WL11]WNC39621.1 DUF192 domain-containing protein [Thermosynechococcus sp. WL17]WNC42142.1 DUF192 domain-containing protein [Thermosynechococcus sp. WL15]